MFKKVLIAGGGVLGSQIALQNAVHGKEVTVYDISDDAVAAAKKRVASFKDLLVADIKEISDEQAQADIAKITYTSDLASALKGIDLVIEAVPESLAIKKISGIRRLKQLMNKPSLRQIHHHYYQVRLQNLLIDQLNLSPYTLPILYGHIILLKSWLNLKLMPIYPRKWKRLPKKLAWCRF